jgi:hypothetical protein
MNDLMTLNGNGTMTLNFHVGQLSAWDSVRRFVAVISGTQGGKTSFGPHWLLREIKRRGAGDYMVVTPTFPLLDLKALPAFRFLFEKLMRLGKYIASPSRRFVFSDVGARRLFGEAWDGLTETRVIFGYASEPESLESATAKAAWLDEAGQKKFRVGSWEAILRRLSLNVGRALITTTPYGLGWLRDRIWEPFHRGDPDVDVVRFESVANPQFSSDEFERARRDLPQWKFDLFYRGLFVRPAGLIYDCFTDAMRVPRFEIPNEWMRYVGLDFGGVNTAAMFYAENPNTRQLVAYRSYRAGGRTAREHVAALLAGEPRTPLAFGGAGSEDQWRNEFAAAGLVVRAPDVKDVEVGIARVYAAHKRGELVAFADLADYLDEKQVYARELDDAGSVTERIEDKETFHLLDAERYVISAIRPGAFTRAGTVLPGRDPLAQIDRGGF